MKFFAIPARLLTVGLAFAAACAPTAEPTTTAAPAPLGPQSVVLEEQVADPGASLALLPAFETAAERATHGKFDVYDEFRIQNKHWYAQTAPLEPGRFRPFGEWEKMKHVWTTYSAGTSGTTPVRRMFAEQTIHFVRDSNPPVVAHVIVPNANTGKDFLKALDEYKITEEEKKNVVLVTLPNQTIWHIDYGAFPMIDKKTNTQGFTDFVYYHPRHVDDAIPTRLARDFYKDATVWRMPFPWEGGNIQTDGVGKCLTSTRALSNTGFSALKVRNLLRKYLACDETIIVKDISDDGTGHIDMFFKWVDVDHVMFGQYDDSISVDYDGDGKVEDLPIPMPPGYAATFDKNKKRMDENAAIFQALTASNGKPFKVSRLTMMTPFRDEYGDLPRTFINSTFTNGVNVYPSYTTKSCRNPAGASCMNNSDCPSDTCDLPPETGKAGKCVAGGGSCLANSDCVIHCAAGKCTTGPATEGCDEILKCNNGFGCADDPLKVALTAKAQKQWEEAMPTWKHVGLRADTIALWSGAIHCITRTIPDLPFAKAIDDGTCIDSQCACVEGGTTQACTESAQCFGPKWVCDCNICYGKCASGKKCTDDADCSADGKTVVDGACNIDPAQSCYGAAAEGCGTVSYEGVCEGKSLKYCNAGTVTTQPCAQCCGWDGKENAYNCLGSSACGEACIPECEAGEKACSDQGTHAWECVDVEGCLKRKWTACGKGATCDDATASCKATGTGPVGGQCPVKPAPDAGSTDTAADDAATGADGVGQTDGNVTQADAAGADAGAAKPVAPPPSGGCTAGPTSGRVDGGVLAALGLLAAALVALRRRLA